LNRSPLTTRGPIHGQHEREVSTTGSGGMVVWLTADTTPNV
jgi:hypothetical protein